MPTYTGMETEEMIGLRSAVNKLKNKMCKNSNVVIDGMKIGNSGCKNERRPGSAWCQDCSDKYKQEQG